MTNFMPAKRLDLPGYPFAKLERIASERRSRGLPLFDLSIGDPDLSPPLYITEATKKALSDQSSHLYPSSRGNASVRKAIADWYKGRFGVELDPESQVCVLIGGKEGLANFARGIVNPGDIVGVPEPGYPVYGRAGCKLVEGVKRTIELKPENSFLPDLREAEGVKLLYLNYPNNPTGATVSDEFMTKLADFVASDPSMTVAYDMAYCEVTYGRPIRSLLEYSSNVVEFHSISKMANATGYRVGFAVGDADRIAALVRVKEEIDSGVPLPFQFGLKALLERYDEQHPPAEVTESLDVYRKRREQVFDSLEKMGFTPFRSDATFYVWFKVGDDEVEFVNRCADSGVLLTPGSGFGKAGTGWVRISVTAPDETVEQAMHILSNMV